MSGEAWTSLFPQFVYEPHSRMISSLYRPTKSGQTERFNAFVSRNRMKKICFSNPLLTSLRAISSRISGTEDDHLAHDSVSGINDKNLELGAPDGPKRIGQEREDLDSQGDVEIFSLVGRAGLSNTPPTSAPRRSSQIMNVSPEFMALAHAQFEALASIMGADRYQIPSIC
jgi:hypothetical protein